MLKINVTFLNIDGHKTKKIDVSTYVNIHGHMTKGVERRVNQGDSIYVNWLITGSLVPRS